MLPHRPTAPPAPSVPVVLPDPFPAPIRSGDPTPAPDARLAPWPVQDRYPVVLGSNLTLAALSSAQRLATSGYRLQYVDAITELRERDAHVVSVHTQRALGVTAQPITVTPCECDESERDEAANLARLVQRGLDNISDFGTAKRRLHSIGLYAGVAAEEITWSVHNGEWLPSRLHFIHTRRLQYPNPGDWDVRIWDQGMVRGWGSVEDWPTSRLFGINPSAYPNKFLIYTPSPLCEYPTRDGIARVTSWYSSLKLMGMRNLSGTAERFGKPWTFATYSTSNDGTPRAANDSDIARANEAMRAMGNGLLSSAVLPDSIKVVMERVMMSGTRSLVEALIDECDEQNSKAVLTNTLTTQAGSKGTQALGTVQERGTLRLLASDAEVFADCIRWGLALPIVRLNAPGKEHLVPMITVGVQPKLDPGILADTAGKLSDRGAPVDADDIAERCGVKLLPNETGAPRALGSARPQTMPSDEPDEDDESEDDDAADDGDDEKKDE